MSNNDEDKVNNNSEKINFPLGLIRLTGEAYARLILRDTVSKIVPGIVFLFIVSSTVYSFNFVNSCLSFARPTHIIIIVTVAWILSTSFQCISNLIFRCSLNIFKDIPHKYVSAEMRLLACSDMESRFQFDIFTVNVEACGNLAISTLLGGIFWASVNVARFFLRREECQFNSLDIEKWSLIIITSIVVTILMIACVFFQTQKIAFIDEASKHIKINIKDE